MQNETISFLPFAISGLISALFLGWMHHQLKQYKFHPVVNYAIGSTSCLLAFSTGLFLTVDLKLAQSVVGAAWMIWVMSGCVVLLTYLLDSLSSKRRAKRVELEEGQEHEPDYSEYTQNG